jgi:hypothetical protein
MNSSLHRPGNNPSKHEFRDAVWWSVVVPPHTNLVSAAFSSSVTGYSDGLIRRCLNVLKRRISGRRTVGAFFGEVLGCGWR